MPPRKDITGQRFGQLTVIEFSEGGKNSKWRCKCDCGNEKVVTYINLKTGNSITCGASIHREGLTLEDLTGRIFGKLTVLSRNKDEQDGQKRTYWNCKCLCPNDDIIVVDAQNLKTGHTQSCGCYFKEQVTVHGQCSKNIRLYRIWRGMMARCYQEDSKSYRWYGAKGITVFKLWHTVSNFVDWALANGYNDNLTLERCRVFEGYSPENCEWIPLSKQARNTTVSLGEAKAIEIRKLLGEGATPKELASKYGVAYTTIISIKNRENYRDL